MNFEFLSFFGNTFFQIILFVYNTIGLQNLGLAIVEIAILTRLLFYPFIKQQAHHTKKMAEIQPHLAALKEKHKGNQQAFAAAQMALFKEHGVNPAGGCVPAIVQLVVIIGLYSAMGQILHGNYNRHFLLWDVGKPDVYHITGFPLPIPGILVIIAALTQFIQTKMMMPAKVVKPVPKKAVVKAGEQKKDAGFMEEFAEAQGSMAWMFPLFFLFLGTQPNFPAGLALYWAVSSSIAIVQQYRLTGLGSLAATVVQLRGLLKR